MRSRPEPDPSWEFVRRWGSPPHGESSASWSSVETWAAAARDTASAVELRVAERRRAWERWLEPLGEISAQDWRDFRPLRLGREEGWSDWLAHLLARSATGQFARALLSQHPKLAGVTAYGSLSVRREVQTIDGERRADILVEWPDAAAHIEVKAGDRGFEKTFETAHLLERSYERGRAWADFILLPPSDLGEWRAATRNGQSRLVIEVTWRDVAVALRQAMKAGGESLHWRTWAHAFCGAVEQRILGCEPAGVAAGSSLERLASGLAQLDVMEAAEG
jgi:hypothetical protein